MREILFRGKQTIDGEWVYGGLIKYGQYCCILSREQDIHPADEPYLDSFTGCIDGYATPITPDTVGQYTGLADKIGKKIFEGDIVHCYGKDSIRAYDWYAVVKFGNPNSTYSWGWQLKPITAVDCNPDILLWVEMSDYIDIYCNVIGNIHDSPELLEVKT